MAVFTEEQLATITAVEGSLAPVRIACSDGTNLLVSLLDLHRQALLNGNLDGEAVFDAAVTEWAAIKARIIAAAAAIL